ncbi:Transmembrane 9 superfamily member [Quillaja saponaria]|uniref:Transmembrane 9 superfamily member n=1 Tax=Quillaja saponaria TaxID=32244 RepID=A0AAD7VHR8_QUISA|nr:Transmembrane 9 superfamily member [Quillaja saponaria]
MASKRRRCIFALILIAIILPLVLSNRNPKFATVQYVNKVHDQYKEGDYIPLLANIVRPAKKSCEAYPYFELPFCPPGDPITGRKKSFEEVLAGDCFNNTLYELKFKVDTLEKLLCKKNLTKDEVAKFRYAVLNEFEYIMYYNKYSLLGHVGIVERKVEYASPRYYILKHIHFYLYYWRNKVKDITLVDVTRGAETEDAVDITEDAEIEVNFTYSATLERAKCKLNSCNQDAVLILLFLTYCLTSSVSGYIATSFHTKFSTVGWKECIFQTGVLFIVPAMSIFVVVNGIAVIAYGVSDIPDLDNAVSVFFKWGLVTFLLLCLGGKIAYLSRPKRQQSCATKLFQMHMSQQPWFLRTSSQMIIGGLLPFTAIFLQIDDIYASLWNPESVWCIPNDGNFFFSGCHSDYFRWE